MDAARQAFNDKATRDATAAYLIALTDLQQGRRGAAGQCRSRHRDLLPPTAAACWAWYSAVAIPGGRLSEPGHHTQHRQARAPGYASRQAIAEGDLWQDISPRGRDELVTCSLPWRPCSRP